MSTEANKACVRRVVEEAWNQGNLTVIDEINAATFVRRDPSTPNVPAGPEGFKQVIRMFRTAFPDLSLTIEEMIAEGETVATRYVLRGTHQGPFKDIAPTGQVVTMTWMNFLRFADGKIVEAWNIEDMLSMMQQLGMLKQVQLYSCSVGRTTI